MKYRSKYWEISIFFSLPQWCRNSRFVRIQREWRTNSHYNKLKSSLMMNLANDESSPTFLWVCISRWTSIITFRRQCDFIFLLPNVNPCSDSVKQSTLNDSSNREGSLMCQTCCCTGQAFLRTMTSPGVWCGTVPTGFNDFGLSRQGLEQPTFRIHILPTAPPWQQMNRCK